MKKILRKFFIFLLVGGVCTAIQYVILISLVSLQNWQPTAASTVGFVASALLNYALNYRFTFKARNGNRVALPRFATVSGSGLLLNAAIMQTGLTYAPFPYWWIQIAATIVVLLWNFVGSLKWSYAS